MAESSSPELSRTMAEDPASCEGPSATGAPFSGSETKVIYHIDEEETPYLVKIALPASEVRLGDFKSVLPSHLQRYKFFFKSKDDDFGVVKEEIVDDQTPLPLFNGRVVSWLVAAEGSVIGSLSDTSGIRNQEPRGDADSSADGTLPPFGIERSSGVGTTRPPSFHGGKSRGGARSFNPVDSVRDTETEGDDFYGEETESSITSVSQIARRRHRLPRLPGPGIPGPSGSSASVIGARRDGATEESSVMSSEIESSLYDETEEAASVASSSRFTTSTEHTSVSRNAINLRHRQKKRSRRKVPAHLARAGSISSVTDSTMSLNIITVTLNMDTVNFLGISIVGQSNKFGDGDCGIYVGSIMKGGAVALDGRIEPGDMILQVNDTNFENVSSGGAVGVLREVVKSPGPIKLVVAKCWDPAPSKGYMSMPRTEPVRPIDPGAWVAHTAAVRELGPPMPPESFVADEPYLSGQSREYLLHGDYPGRAPSVTTLSASSIVSSQPETEKYFPHQIPSGPLMPGQPPPPVAPPLGHAYNTQQPQESLQLLPSQLSRESGMVAILNAMRKPDSGLEVRDRMWLKIKIPNAFLGSDVVDWLFDKVEGFPDRRDSRKYATQMLKAGFIKHTVNKTTFSEQCYYAFGDESSLNLSKLSLNDTRDSGEAQHAPTSHLYQPPMASNGSAGSSGWPVGSRPLPLGPGFEVPWAGSGSNTSYGPIYNPAAPPPSANYSSMPAGYPGGYPANDVANRTISSSGSSHKGPGVPMSELRLAGSGSGSESASDGRCSELGVGRGPPVLRPVPPPVIGNSSGII